MLAEAKRAQDLADDIARQQQSLQASVDLATSMQRSSQFAQQAQGFVKSLKEAFKATEESAALVARTQQFTAVFQPMLDQIWPGIVQTAELAKSVLYPPNWARIDDIDLNQVRDIGEHEGIPLMWIPRSATVKKLLAADSQEARRELLAAHMDSILEDCRASLAAIEQDTIAGERAEALATGTQFGMQACAALAAGHLAAAQALATTLLDTVLERLLARDTHTELTTRKLVPEFNAEEYAFRGALTLGPVWAAHQRFDRQQRDVIPIEYGRHPSVHGVSSRQYNATNAIIAVMLITSVLVFYATVRTPERISDTRDPAES